MEKETIEVYVCSHCKETKHLNEQWMRQHEEICPMNPKNQPCSMCENQILGLGCSKGMNMEDIGGNVLCFHYRKGIPQNPMSILLEGNHLEDDEND